jgi:hypothetical protein
MRAFFEAVVMVALCFLIACIMVGAFGVAAVFLACLM